MGGQQTKPSSSGLDESKNEPETAQNPNGNPDPPPSTVDLDAVVELLDQPLEAPRERTVKLKSFADDHRSHASEDPLKSNCESVRSDCDSVKSSGEVSDKRAKAEDLDSLIQFLESDQVDEDFQEAARTNNQRSNDLDELVELLERDVRNPNADVRRWLAPIQIQPPAEPMEEDTLDSLSISSARGRPISAKRPPISSANSDADLEFWAGLLDDQGPRPVSTTEARKA
mmetsp:Transcript_45289/g.120445  ORF Transcript_45289/g.120445 Transcript_45289/m.120445 type:complete len:228 (-) Transcript_45289:720-1403(-)